MDGEVDTTAKQRLVDLLGEQALAAEFAQRHVLDGIARGLDHGEIDLALGQPIGNQEAAHMVRLPKGERAAAGADQKWTCSQ